MIIASGDIAPILTALATLITVVGGIVIQVRMTRKQNVKIAQHAEEAATGRKEVKDKIEEVASAIQTKT